MINNPKCHWKVSKLIFYDWESSTASQLPVMNRENTENTLSNFDTCLETYEKFIMENFCKIDKGFLTKKFCHTYFKRFYNLGQNTADKFTKLHRIKVGFSTQCFTSDYLLFSSTNVKNGRVV